MTSPIAIVSVVLALGLAGCAANETALTTESQSSETGAPGYAALRSDGCAAVEVPQGETFEPRGWVPINDVVAAADLAIFGTVDEVSSPRITTLDYSDASGDAPELMYFRLLYVNVEAVDSGDDPPRVLVEGDRVPLIVFGAGPDVDPGDLCYGPDGKRHADEPRFDEGSQIYFLGKWQEPFPIAGMDAGAFYLPTSLIGLWTVDESGNTSSISASYEQSIERLRERVRAEFRNGNDAAAPTSGGEPDPLSDPPTAEESSTSTTIPNPPIPPRDLPNSPTIPTPRDDN